ncbi:winged helix-turn-helix domain-containing protein [Serratia fonticola]|uniref:Winged helix-turn-helix domain-containing protein n=1 Tax=Serratia fonticola TaxID=47917 RepID=A0ABY9PSH9_SERFO|nr:winged helix-turn-helix domain-containing protein [Serratia fonticola]WMT16058.1 winged helix-turn-helix domain-containing protein [Serratia fonticola]
MDRMYIECSLYGFLLDGDVFFNIDDKKLLRYSENDAERSVFFKAIPLNDIQVRLLIYLLENSQAAVIHKNDILENVWDEFGLLSSYQRLWQTVNEVRKKLSAMGLSDDFITNVHGIGYSIDSPKVMSLLIK